MKPQRKQAGIVLALFSDMASIPRKRRTTITALRERILLWMWRHGWASRPL